MLDSFETVLRRHFELTLSSLFGVHFHLMHSLDIILVSYFELHLLLYIMLNKILIQLPPPQLFRNPLAGTQS